MSDAVSPEGAAEQPAPAASGADAQATSLRTVSWRQVVGTLVVTALALGALVFAIRSEGLPAVDAVASRSTRWFVHQPSGRAVLVDGFGGRAIASVPAGVADDDIVIAEGGGQAFVLNDSNAEARAIDTAELRLGPPIALSTLGSGAALARAGASGLLVADPAATTGTFLPLGGEAVDIDFELDPGEGRTPEVSEVLALAPDGSIWSVDGRQLRRATTTGTSVRSLGSS